MSSAKRKKLKPFEARTIDQICTLYRDNLDAGDFWILIDGDHIVLTEQCVGQPAKAQVKIPRRHFIRLARWYMTGKVGK